MGDSSDKVDHTLEEGLLRSITEHVLLKTSFYKRGDYIEIKFVDPKPGEGDDCSFIFLRYVSDTYSTIADGSYLSHLCTRFRITIAPFEHLVTDFFVRVGIDHSDEDLGPKMVDAIEEIAQRLCVREIRYKDHKGLDTIQIDGLGYDKVKDTNYFSKKITPII